jgi:hypothetical protein
MTCQLKRKCTTEDYVYSLDSSGTIGEKPKIASKMLCCPWIVISRVRGYYEGVGEKN